MLPFSLMMQFTVGIKSYFHCAGSASRLPDDFFGYFRRGSRDGSQTADRALHEILNADDYGKTQIFPDTLFRLRQTEKEYFDNNALSGLVSGNPHRTDDI